MKSFVKDFLGAMLRTFIWTFSTFLVLLYLSPLGTEDGTVSGSRTPVLRTASCTVLQLIWQAPKSAQKEETCVAGIRG